MAKNLGTKPKQKIVSSRLVGGIFVLISCLAPYILFFDGSFRSLALDAMTWSLIVTPHATDLIIRYPTEWFGVMILPLAVIPQMFFSYFIYRLYQGKTTVRRVFEIGLFGALPTLAWGVLNALPRLWDPTYPYGFEMFPIPVILLIGYLFVKRYAPPLEVGHQQWLESEE